jgi:uroporphyrinogen-III synthase
VSARPSVLVTGPVNGLDDYVAAAERAGWDAIAFPLLAIDPRVPLEPPALPDWIAVTSSNALAWLESAARLVPALLQVPCAVVGERTAERARELHLAIALEPAPDAATLSAALRVHVPSGARILWPHGPRSEALGVELERAGWTVDAPLAYEHRGVAPAGPVPATDAVFFASPSAVRAFADLERAVDAGERPTALSIGPTTFDALLETAAGLSRTASLAAPTPDGLAEALRHLRGI